MKLQQRQAPETDIGREIGCCFLFHIDKRSETCTSLKYPLYLQISFSYLLVTLRLRKRGRLLEVRSWKFFAVPSINVMSTVFTFISYPLVSLSLGLYFLSLRFAYLLFQILYQKVVIKDVNCHTIL